MNAACIMAGRSQGRAASVVNVGEGSGVMWSARLLRYGWKSSATQTRCS